MPVIGVGMAANTARRVAKVRARLLESFLRFFWIKNVGTKTARKHNGIAMTQIGGTQSKTIQRLSTATRISADKV